MADPKSTDRESLDDFHARFGRLSDRAEQAIHPSLDRRDMPTAERPDRIETRETAPPEAHHTWPDKTSQPDFERASNDNTRQEAKGVGSKQVSEDAPTPKPKPPEDSRSVDRTAHRAGMKQDDTRARFRMKDSYFDRLDARLRDAELEQRVNAQTRSRSQDFEQSR